MVREENNEFWRDLKPVEIPLPLTTPPGIYWTFKGLQREGPADGERGGGPAGDDRGGGGGGVGVGGGAG